MKVEVKWDDLYLLMRSTMRYAMGRSSYVPVWIRVFIVIHLDKFTESQRLDMAREIEGADYLGEEREKYKWIEFARILRDV